ncbi:protein kinase C delta type-like [Anomaloglossus baeobatrachus]|uniref:protein kinase C delta type-like n=1 Tax=Anomaloglossus baeobatrachus TaxID=238106 RepID=UPI003F4F98F7
MTSTELNNRKRKGERLGKVSKKSRIEASEGEQDDTNQNIIKASKRPGSPIQESVMKKKKKEKHDTIIKASKRPGSPIQESVMKKKKKEKHDTIIKASKRPGSPIQESVMKKKKKEKHGTIIKASKRSGSPIQESVMKKKKKEKHGTIIKASKRSGSPIQESIRKKKKMEEEMGYKTVDRPSVSPDTDNEQLSGTTPDESPIIVTGVESFTFHKILGEGSYGKVMLATHQACQKQVAVKMVKKRLLVKDSRDDVLIERQVLEMTRKSPFISRAFATFQSQEHVFYAMEYLSGGDLTGFMTTNAPLPIPATRFFAAELICGLQFLHTSGIIHRDIKPDNILLDNNGHLKIADFGLAVMNIFGNAKTSGWAGTLAYMAPEILLEKPYNKAVDWFSAGVVIYEMATGRYPFVEDEIDENIKKALINDDPAFPKELDPHVKAVIEGLLDKSPESRQKFVDNIREHPFFMEINWTEIEGGKAPPPFHLPPPPVMTSDTMKDVNFSKAIKPRMAKKNQKLFCGFTFADDGWKVVKKK